MPVSLYGQGQSGYEMSFRPDVWYNDVDGIRIGSLFEGRMAGTGQEGPHRLDGGIWVSTWFPSLPVSYSLTYTEPLFMREESGDEFNIQLHSSVREGYQKHGASLNKRWQKADDYLNYWETGLGYYLEKRFDDEYTLFPDLWSDSWKGMLKPYLAHHQINRAGVFNLELFSRFNTLETSFYTASLSISQQIRLGGMWQLRLRGHGDIVSSDVYEEYRLFRASGSEIETLNRPVSRSKGTVPVLWSNRGFVHFSGGANIRGYRKSDVTSIKNSDPRAYERVGALNAELDFPNPVQPAIGNIEYLSEFLSFRTYLFSDAASATGHHDPDLDGLFANIGAGLALTLNIPDHLGKPRGFVIRYESPFWLSDPEGEKNFKWRHLLGFGATITF